jgi:hypothetical protein
MTDLAITPLNMARMYDFLRATDPFTDMRLPRPGKGRVTFKVSRHKDRFAHMQGYRRIKESEIIMSSVWVGCTLVFAATMAHEMIHLYQHLNGMETPGTEHNAQFLEIAEVGCRIHGFDYKTFF